MENEPEPEDQQGLSLVTTQQLLTELCGRFDHVIVCGVKVTGPEDMQLLRKWRGNGITALGLSKFIEDRILEDIYENSTDGSVEDL